MNTNPESWSLFPFRLAWLLIVFASRSLAQDVTLSLPSTVTAPEDTVATVPFSINGLQPGDEPVVTVHAANSRLIQTNATVIRLNGSAGFIELTPVPNQFGGATFSVSLQVGTRGVFRTGGSVNWTRVDDAPELEPIPPQVTSQGAPPLSVLIRYQSVDSPGLVSFTASSSRSNFVQVLTANRVGTNSVLTVRPLENAIGTTVITIQGTSGKATNHVSFPFTILPRELAPPGNVNQGLPLARIASWADVNGDGQFDLVSESATSPTVSLQSSSQTGIRWVNSGGLPASRFGTASWGDYDGDGDVDLYLISDVGGSLLRNETPPGKSPRFVAVPLNLPLFRPTSASWSDFDDDGDLDLLLSGTSVNQPAGSPFILRNAGNNQFTAVTTGLPNTTQPALAADFDDDGLPDILSVVTGAGNTGTNLVVHYNQGNLAFATSTLKIPVRPVLALGTVDADGDGRLDVWVHQGIVRGQLSIQDVDLTLCLRTAQGFSPRVIVAKEVYGSSGAPAWGDFDGDGEPDFIAPRTSSEFYQSGGQLVRSNYFSVYRHLTGDAYSPGRFLSLSGTGRPVVADVGGDSSLDVWLPGAGPSPVFLNQFRPGNVPPGTPPDLNAFNLGRSILFTWGRADDQNQSAPLTYNLRVGSRPGANDVVASMSTSSGTRLVSEPGNTGMARQRFLELPSLDTAELYWSVQAVDNSYAAGAWAPEQKVTLPVTGPNQPPVLSGLNDQGLLEDGQRSMTFGATDDRTAPENLRVEAVSSNPALLLAYPTNRISSQGAGPPAIALVAQPNQSGRTTVNVTVTDRGGLQAHGQFTVEVQPVNDPPSVSEIGFQSGKTGEPIGPLEFTVADLESPADELKVEVALSSLNGPIAGLSATVSGSGAQRFVTLTSSAIAPRSGLVSLTVTDPQGARTAAHFPVTFTNDVPQFVAGLLKPADYDGDGALDVFVAGESPKPIGLYSNTGNGQLAEIDVLPPELQRAVKDVSAEWADFDGDGRLDLVVSGRYEATEAPFTAVLWNHGGRFTFSSLNRDTLPPLRGPVQVGDIDGDSDVDVVQCGTVSDLPSLRLRVFLNQRGSFTVHDLVLSNDGGEVSELLLADFDGNGLPDLSLQSGNTGLVFLNAGNLVFEATTTPWTGERGALLAVADLNGDGWVEGFGRPAGGDSGPTSGFLNDHKATFLAHALFGSSVARIVVGDLDGDGDLDLLVRSHLPDSAVVLKQSATGDWNPERSLPGTGYRAVALGDFDGDGRLDVLASLTNGSEVSSEAGPITLVLKNNEAERKPAPSAPPNPSALIVANGISRLSWSPALAPVPTNGFTYNLRIGTHAGANDVMPGNSLQNGHRLLPQPGNAGARSAVDLRLPAGTYFWAVQAVDASYVGGAFCPEQSFTVPPVPGAASVQLVPTVDGGLSVRLQDSPDGAVWLERSNDLNVWTQLHRLQLDHGGYATLELEADQNVSPSFFRLRPVE